MNTPKLLPRVQGNPALLRQLSPVQLRLLSQEIRGVLIDTVSHTGGHLASNLGSVELTLALLRVLDVPEDKIVWDVGHQCYTYKMLTDRGDRMDTMRQQGGISGFPRTAESPYDAFIAGHASTSLAAAYGLKRAMAHAGDPHTVAAVVGDGAFTGGMVFEGLNNIGRGKENLLLILNDNEMAISRNEGALAKYLSVLRSKPEYFRFKNKTERALRRVPLVGEALRDAAADSKAFLKHAIYPSTFFEEFGFTYFGPVDGHDITALCSVLQQAKKCGGPAFVHVKTVKGKGYRCAEDNPGAFHGIGKFDVVTGEPLSKSGETYSDVFGKELARLAHEDDRIVAVTAAMEHGTGLQTFARAFKGEGRYYDVGIAEEYAVTFSAALAAGGRLPVFAVYSTFLQRAYDQLLHDVAIEPRHVVFAIDRAGVVGDDGETHQGLFDAAYLSTVPGMTVLSPASFDELRGMLDAALNEYTTPVAVRYPRGGEDKDAAVFRYDPAPYTLFKHGGDTLLVTYGRISAAALDAAKRVGADLLKLNRIIPIDESTVTAALGYRRVFFAEEGIAAGGIGMQFLAALSLAGYRGRTALRAVSGFVPQSSVAAALQKLGLDSDSLAAWLGEETA